MRFDDFTLVRGGGASLPLYRAFVKDRIVEPENGPATRELARVVQRELLPREPYRSYGITLDQFFSSGSFRMLEDLVGLDDSVWGWDDDYGHPSRVGREAVLAHPGRTREALPATFASSLWWPLYAATAGASGSTGAVRRRVELPADRRNGLPVPTEGGRSASRQSSYMSTPDGRIREVSDRRRPSTTSSSATPPMDSARQRSTRKSPSCSRLFRRGARLRLRGLVNDLSRIYPRPAMWLLAGLLLVAISRPRRASVPLVLSGAALLILVFTALAVYAVAQYSVPVTPAFVLLAATGAFGTRSA